MGKSVIFVFSGGHVGDFAAEISPFSAPGSQGFHQHKRKSISFSSNQTYGTI